MAELAGRRQVVRRIIGMIVVQVVHIGGAVLAANHGAGDPGALLAPQRST